MAVLGQAVKSAGIRNGNVALFSKIRQCAQVPPEPGTSGLEKTAPSGELEFFSRSI